MVQCLKIALYLSTLLSPINGPFRQTFPCNLSSVAHLPAALHWFLGSKKWPKVSSLGAPFSHYWGSAGGGLGLGPRNRWRFLDFSATRRQSQSRSHPATRPTTPSVNWHYLPLTGVIILPLQDPGSALVELFLLAFSFSMTSFHKKMAGIIHQEHYWPNIYSMESMSLVKWTGYHWQLHSSEASKVQWRPLSMGQQLCSKPSKRSWEASRETALRKTSFPSFSPPQPLP